MAVGRGNASTTWLKRKYRKILRDEYSFGADDQGLDTFGSTPSKISIHS
jgi:hypothetical protein